MGRLTTILVLSMLLASCQNTAPPVATPTPSPSPHTAVSAAVLQPGEVPTGLASCTTSGSMDVYISSIKAANPELSSRLAAQWQGLQAAGATDGSITLFASDQSACSAELGAAARIRSAASFVAVFADEGQADRAWQAGVLGFVPPAPDQVAAGIMQGPATGLGPSSWTYDRQPVRLASWKRSVFVALVVFTNLDANAFKAATGAVDARLH